MRKATLATLLLILGFQVWALSQNTRAADDQKFFEDHLKDLVKLKLQPLDAPAVAKVLSGNVYKVRITISQYLIDSVLARVGDKAADLSEPSSNSKMPEFAKVVKPSFKLKTDADAKTLQGVFDSLYPVDGADRLDVIRHQGDVWTFIDGKFFDHFKGFVVTTDDKGTITEVKRSLEIKKS